MPNDNKNLHKAKAVKNDEFYTFYEDVEAELRNYNLRGKDVYCPCDTEESAFFRYLSANFAELGLKRLTATSSATNTALVKTLPDMPPARKLLSTLGDFRSPDCVEFLKSCDIVITNPPFSLFREFVGLIHQHNKDFIIIGNQNAFTYKEIFKLIKANKVRTGYNMVKQFKLPDGATKKFGNVCWFTTLPRETEFIPLTKEYTPTAFPKYDNYDAIEVSRVANIPKDYDGVMGVPITFINKYNQEQFEIVGNSRYQYDSDEINEIAFINGKEIYKRILIKRKV